MIMQVHSYRWQTNMHYSIHCNDVTWGSWSLKSPATRLLSKSNSKEKSNLRITSHLRRESNGHTTPMMRNAFPWHVVIMVYWSCCTSMCSDKELYIAGNIFIWHSTAYIRLLARPRLSRNVTWDSISLAAVISNCHSNGSWCLGYNPCLSNTIDIQYLHLRYI